MERLGDTFSPEGTKGYQLTIVTQLRRVMTTMHRPDEMFRWLASVIVQRFDISIMQFWTCESSRLGQSSARLQAMAHQDPSLPAQLVVNEKVALIVEHISRGQPISPPRGVEQMFPS